MTRYNRRTLLAGIAAAALVAGGISYFASTHPDGLEKAQEQLGAAPAHEAVPVPPTPFEGYNLRCLGGGFWSNAAAGVAGVLLVFGTLYGVGHLLKRCGSPTSHM